jgi:hypothetical protein
MEERWLPVVGYAGIYEISDSGKVRSLDRYTSHGRSLRGRQLIERPLPNGRPRVSLSYNAKTVDAYPYRLVLEAFVGPCPPGMETLHWDDDPNNNNLQNLRWGTRAENMQDMSRNGNGNAGVTHCPSGHAYSPENTYTYPGDRKHRGCRACGRQHSANRRTQINDQRRAG